MGERPLPEPGEERRTIEAFHGLEMTVQRILAGEAGLKRDAMARIFELNTWIGRLAATDARRRPELRRLQLAVNGITSAVKREDPVLMRESWESAKKQLLSMVPG